MHVGRRRQRRAALRGDHRRVAALIGLAPLPAQEAARLELVDEPGDPASGQQDEVGEVRHPEPGLRLSLEPPEDLEGAEREAGPPDQDGVERPTATATRTRDLVGTWTVDPAHSQIGFSVKHMKIATVRGSFEDFEGGFSVAEDPAASKAWAKIDASSINTGNADRDAHLNTGDFFEVDSHPELTFESTGIEILDDDRARANGDLTIRGVTRPIALDVGFHGIVTDATGTARAAFTATGKINREDFGLTWNQTLETGGVLVSKDVTLEIEVAAVRRDS